MTKERASRDFPEESGVKCICIRDAPLKVDLFWTHGIIQRVSGRKNKLFKTVRVRLVGGWSPNGQSEFDMDANEKVNVLIIKRMGSKQGHFNLKPHRRKQQNSSKPSNLLS
jgi:hypothetical protein